MPNPCREKVKMGKLTGKSASFHGRNAPVPTELRRPKTETELLSGRKVVGVSPETLPPPRLTKLLLNVTIQRSLGAVHVVIPSESTVGDLIAATVKQYVKEERRPLLTTTDPSTFDLHYSSFSLESLDREEKLITLGSRNFFMCPTQTKTTTAELLASSSSCSEEAEKASKVNGIPWSRRLLELFN